MSITARKRTPTRSVEDTEAGWLLLSESGMSAEDIAKEAGVKPRRVYQGIADARRREPTQGSADTSRRVPESTPNFGPRNPTALPIYGVRPFVRAELRPVAVDISKDLRRFVKALSAEPPPRGVLRPGEDGARPPEHPKSCPHRGPIQDGSVAYCEDCAGYGRPWDKRLVIDARERPKPEPRPSAPEPVAAKPKAGKASGKMHRRKLRRRKALQPQTQTA